LPREEDLTPAPIKDDLEEWFYIDREALEDAAMSLDSTSDLRIALDCNGA
jgi:inorganic pyrophosphatase